MNRNRNAQPDAAPDLDTVSSNGSNVSDNAVEAGRRRMEREDELYNSVSPELTAGDVDAEWQEAEDSGAETPGGHMSTPDQDNVDELGRAVGMEFQDNQELRTHDEVLSKRDRHRWELDKRSTDGDSI